MRNPSRADLSKAFAKLSIREEDTVGDAGSESGMEKINEGDEGEIELPVSLVEEHALKVTLALFFTE